MYETLNKLLNDETFMKQLLSLETDLEVQNLLKENGVEISLEEIAQIKRSVELRLSDSNDLSEEDLEKVVGGSDATDIVDCIVSFLCNIGDAIHEWTRGRW